MTKTKLYPMDSTMIASAGYDKGHQLMAIRFFEGPKNFRMPSESIYIYTEVPHTAYVQLRKARHQGRYFHRNIRGKFEFVKVDDAMFFDKHLIV